MKIGKFQEGGAMPQGGTPAAAPQSGEPQGSGNPLDQIIPAMQQAVQAQDCNTLMQVCSAFLQIVGDAANAQQQAGPQPAFARRGGRLVRIG